MAMLTYRWHALNWKVFIAPLPSYTFIKSFTILTNEGLFNMLKQNSKLSSSKSIYDLNFEKITTLIYSSLNG
jgi:hypothetical protein